MGLRLAGFLGGLRWKTKTEKTEMKRRSIKNNQLVPLLGKQKKNQKLI